MCIRDRCQRLVAYGVGRRSLSECVSILYSERLRLLERYGVIAESCRELRRSDIDTATSRHVALKVNDQN